MKRVAQCTLAVILVFSGVARADVTLPKIFSDNMVLQQELPIAVWGKASPGESVTVTLAEKSVSTKADTAGRWRVDLPPMKADGKKRTLLVKGNNTISLENVLLGEVWLCSGQSNMSRSVEIHDDHTNIRLFWIDGSTVPLEEDLGWTAGWVESTAEGLASAAPIHGGRFEGNPRKSFTEVGYVFGRRIHEELNVPVGLIKSAYGGSNIKAWTPRADIADEYPFGQEATGTYLGHRSGLLYQAMLHGMVPLTIRGVVWYQGENDGRSTVYAEEKKQWIESWRGLWNRPDMPFYFVQIGPTSYAGGRMQYIWEAQSWVMENVPHTGLAVSNDIYPADAVRLDEKLGLPISGNSNPHPPNKHIVGERAAQIALVKTYGQAERTIFGPIYDSHTIDGNKVTVKLKYTGSGLSTVDGKPLNWFQLAAERPEGERYSEWHPARAEIVAPDTIVVTSPEVDSPKHVRFAWHCTARHNLINKEGLPAVSFRTDDESR